MLDGMQRVVVIGAGVIGLTCAIRLAEAGHRVDVVARDLPLETTSTVAAALWYPYLALPQDLVTAWAATSYETYAELAGGDTGVRMLAGTEVLRESSPDPWWRSAVPDLRRVAPPEGYADAGEFESPVADMPVYLSWLRDRLEDLGGTVTRAALEALPHPGDAIVVNCAGLGAHGLVPDASVRPVRGQVVVLADCEVDRWWLDGAVPTYVVPRGDTVVIGGTEESGDWHRSPRGETAADIVARASALVPAVAGARIVAHRVGLRPARPAVRLEQEGRVVHCYGHGGAGMTLSWGCAADVAALVEAM